MNPRSFLKLAGLGSATFAAGCSPESPKFLYRLVRAPEDMVTGGPAWYASTCRECPAGCGVVAKNRSLAGHAAFIESKTTQIAHGDTPKEIGEIFGRYFDGIAIRHVDWGIGNGYLNAVAKASRVPVLNMQCDIYHPFQCLADLMTIIEKKGRDLRRKKMVVSWAYAASYQKPMSVPQSLVLQMPRFGMDVVLAHPPEFKLMPENMDQAREQARHSQQLNEDAVQALFAANLVLSSLEQHLPELPPASARNVQAVRPALEQALRRLGARLQARQ